MSDDSDQKPVMPATEERHQALFVRSAKYPQLVGTICSCGRSAYGATSLEHAKDEHARHAANPAGGFYRTRDVTIQIFGTDLVALAAHPSTPPNTIKERSA